MKRKTNLTVKIATAFVLIANFYLLTNPTNYYKTFATNTINTQENVGDNSATNDEPNKNPPDEPKETTIVVPGNLPKRQDDGATFTVDEMNAMLERNWENFKKTPNFNEKISKNIVLISACASGDLNFAKGNSFYKGHRTIDYVQRIISYLIENLTKKKFGKESDFCVVCLSPFDKFSDIENPAKPDLLAVDPFKTTADGGYDHFYGTTNQIQAGNFIIQKLLAEPTFSKKIVHISLLLNGNEPTDLGTNRECQGLEVYYRGDESKKLGKEIVTRSLTALNSHVKKYDTGVEISGTTCLIPDEYVLESKQEGKPGEKLPPKRFFKIDAPTSIIFIDYDDVDRVKELLSNKNLNKRLAKQIAKGIKAYFKGKK